MSDGSKKRLRNDIILVFVIFAIAFSIFLIFFLGGRTGERVKVLIDGDVIAVYPLYEDRTVDIDFDANSDYINQLVIKDGKAYVSEANCPDGICKAHYAVSKNGETVVCLPHRLVIEIE